MSSGMLHAQHRILRIMDTDVEKESEYHIYTHDRNVLNDDVDYFSSCAIAQSICESKMAVAKARLLF